MPRVRTPRPFTSSSILADHWFDTFAEHAGPGGDYWSGSVSNAIRGCQMIAVVSGLSSGAISAEGFIWYLVRGMLIWYVASDPRRRPADLQVLGRTRRNHGPSW